MPAGKHFKKWFTYFSGNPSLCLTLTFSHSLLCSREEEEIPGKGAVSCCSLPAGTDQSRLSADIIQRRDLFRCLA